MGTSVVQQALRLTGMGVTVAFVSLAAACSSGESSSPAPAEAGESATTAATTTADTATTAGETGATAPVTQPAETATTGAETDGATPAAATSCAETQRSGSVEDLACAWIAEADPAVCARMSDRLLGELFGMSGADGVAQCKSVLGGLSPAEDASLVTLGEPERRRKRATLVVSDGNQEIVYAFAFVRSGGRWTIDGVQQLENAGAESSGGDAETVTPASPGDDGEIAALVTRWYEDVDPGVCDSMTNRMLDFGWGAKGAKGRAACEQALAEAEPLEDVEVRKPAVSGDEATVEVVYTLRGDRQIDELTLVRVNGAWLVDSARLAGFDDRG